MDGPGVLEAHVHVWTTHPASPRGSCLGPKEALQTIRSLFPASHIEEPSEPQGGLLRRCLDSWSKYLGLWKVFTFFP